MDGTGVFLTSLRDELAHWADIIVVSYSIESPRSYDALIDQVEATLPQGPLVLLGESFSGPIAIRIAARNPDKIAVLVLAATFYRRPVPSFVFRLGRWLDPRRVPRTIMELALIGWHGDANLAQRLKSVLSSMPRSTLQARMDAVECCDVEADLSRVTMPTLVLGGTRDRIVSLASLNQLVGKLPHAELVMIEAQHMLLATHALQAGAEIKAFIDKISAGAAVTNQRATRPTTQID